MNCATADYINQSIERPQQASRRIEYRILALAGVLDAGVVELRRTGEAA